MQAVILAGGLGTRLGEETSVRPKPMVEIGGKPILWHIMKVYSAGGVNDFVICLGYKGYLIKVERLLREGRSVHLVSRSKALAGSFQHLADQYPQRFTVRRLEELLEQE